jgi:hypothetical protein
MRARKQAIETSKWTREPGARRAAANATAPDLAEMSSLRNTILKEANKNI